MKKVFLVATFILAAALCAFWYLLATTPGARTTLGAITSRLAIPVEWSDARSTSFGHFDAANFRVPLKEVEAIASTSRHAVWFGLKPSVLHFDSKFSGVQLRLTRPQLGDRSIFFSEGMVLAQLHADGTSYLTFVDWVSPQMEFACVVALDKNGTPTRLRAGGAADPALLSALLFKKEPPKTGEGTKVPFHIVYESELLEVSVNGKPWLRSRWKMRQENPSVK